MVGGGPNCRSGHVGENTSGTTFCENPFARQQEYPERLWLLSSVVSWGSEDASSDGFAKGPASKQASGNDLQVAFTSLREFPVLVQVILLGSVLSSFVR